MEGLEEGKEREEIMPLYYNFKKFEKYYNFKNLNSKKEAYDIRARKFMCLGARIYTSDFSQGPRFNKDCAFLIVAPL